jgi:uncharacterized membrane protein
MHGISNIAWVVNTFATGILAGVLFLSALGLRPAASMLESAQQVVLRQQLIQRLRTLMTPFMLLPILASAVALGWRETSSDWTLAGAGFAFSFATVAVTVFVNVPLNWRFAAWSPNKLPTNWQMYVRKWDRANSIRFMFALAAFACALFSGR